MASPLHVLGDMLGSVGAIAAGFVMWRFETKKSMAKNDFLVSAMLFHSPITVTR